ncbi:MAG: hypothetical protein LKF99_04465 [Bifidobacterium sp.]|jgi:uncharacterized protein YcfJ|nr:hypothetical protein [Bifidobacterium sp.]
MTNSNFSALQHIGGQFGLAFDKQVPCLFGAIGGYTMTVQRDDEKQPAIISVSVSYQAMMPDSRALKELTKSCKVIKSCAVKGYRVDYTVPNGITKKKSNENLREAIGAVAAFLEGNGFVNCCEHSGEITNTRACVIAGKPQLLSLASFQQLQQEAHDKNLTTPERSENIVGGIIGALFGSIIGAAMIVLIGQLGYVAVISGLVMGFCTVKGYELLSHRLDLKGIVISAAIMLVMVYVANRVDWSLTIMREVPGAGFFDAFKAVPDLLSHGNISMSSYATNLGLEYLFTIVGAVPTVISLLKNKELSTQYYVMVPEGQQPEAGVFGYTEFAGAQDVAQIAVQAPADTDPFDNVNDDSRNPAQLPGSANPPFSNLPYGGTAGQNALSPDTPGPGTGLSTDSANVQA